ncbi:hypothetical protein KKD19_00505 [Patescibacteria group bacterium]|nr:hypothetical protein [Patescibacteria group bacterium]MBU4511713.1 hypothetical protein [Patescibacteria group bacterium]
MSDILKKIESAGLLGRGGAGFPTHLKWKAVKIAKAKQKYLVVNFSEGELGLFKDIHIMKNFPETVFTGIKVTLDFLGIKDCYFNFNKRYYPRTRVKVLKLIKKYKNQGYKFTIFLERPSYIGGEETALLNALEGKRTEPRLKPPFPTQAGLFACPTLVHNIETLFNVGLVSQGKFEDKRFYCLSGVEYKGVYFLPADWNIQKILEHTRNIPKFDFFVQIGGSVSGEVLNSSQIKNKKAEGAGSIEAYKLTASPRTLLLKWFKFYAHEACGKCGPCRMGNYNVFEILKKNKKVDWDEIIDLIESMQKTSFCALGKSTFVPVESYVKNVLGLKISLRQI